MENHNTKIIQWNCNGIRGKMEEIKMLLSKYNPSILCIQETRLLQSLVVNFNNYSVFRYDHTGGETASQGLITLVKKCHYVNRINIQSTLQAIAIQIKHPIYNFLTICNIYIHPSHRLQQTEISNLIEQLPTPFLLIGDFNAHNPIWGSINRCNKGKIIENILYQTEQICCLNNGSPTHLSTQGTLTCIDISLCSASIYQDTTWQVLDPQSADHFPILISTKNFNPTTVTDDNHGNSIDPSNLLWSYKKADWTKFRETIEWDHSQTDDINTSITQFNQAILTAAKEAIPTVQLNQLKKFVPWWCKEVKDALKDRNRAYRLFKQHPSTTNLIDFKKKRAIARNTIHNKKKESWHNFMSTISTTKNPRLLWSHINKIRGNFKSKRIAAIQPSPHCNITIDRRSIAETLASHFQLISSTANYTQEFQKYKEEMECVIQQQLSITDTQDHLNINFSIDELETALMKKTSAATGPDGISYNMLTNLPKNIREGLLNTFNRIWTQRSYPDTWRQATIIPIVKPNKDPLKPDSYRPISLLSCTSKLLEKMVNSRINWHLDQQSLLNPHQCGGRKHLATTDLLTYLEKEIATGIALKQHTIAVFLDIQKAFDLTWRAKVLYKASQMGIQGNMLAYLSNFLTNRSFRVKVDRTFSSPKHHENGISQGSPLSCTLFNIAVSDISSCIPEGVSHGLYVDDLFLVARNHDILHVQIILQDALNNLGTWSEQNGLRFSPEKSSCINFKRGRKLQNDPPLSLYGQLIEYKTSHKLLGITLDTEFSFKIHLENIKSKAHKALNCIKILNGKRYGVNRNILARIYKATIRPILDYGSTIYDGAKESDLNKLEVIQNSALRIISGALRTSPVISLRADNGIPPLSLRRKILIGNYICRILQNPKNPGYEATIQHPPQSNINFNRKHKPTSTRFKQYFTDANINLTNTAYMKQSIPPWTITLPETQLLLKEKKSNISPNEIKSKFNQLLNKVNCKETFYCDGSKSPQHCGSAFVHEGNTISFKLPNISSSYTAEIIALQKCIQFITQNKYSNPTIFTDSKSLILAIKQRNTSNPLIKNIQEVLHQSKLTGTTTNIVWIPGHSGIAGNELADAGAKNINAQSQCQTICAQDLKNVFKNICASNWTREWQQTDKQLRKIKPETQYWPTSSRQKRIEEVIIARLRIGHTRVSHSYLIDKKPRPICDTCHTPLSVAHILIECTKFQVERQKLLPHPLTLENLLGNNKETIDSTLKYLYKTKLFGTL
ncbi:hypothetical protein M8J77_008009 [Diaphorina citri]|nr:hypothetical protein M8J77_008009 [Diaphorina citri]